MKVYTHNYTLPEKVEDLLDRAKLLMENECWSDGIRHIKKARQLLREYLSKDNMEVNFDKRSYGYVKEQDTFDDDQLYYIRDEFACIMERTENANDELDIINKCCRLLGDPEYESYEEFTKDTSGSWAEKYIPEEEP